MAIDYTTAGIIESVKLRAMAPTSQSLFTNSRLLSILNEVQYSLVVPWMMSQRQDFFKDFVDIPVSATESTYNLPQNTLGEKIAAIFYGREDSQPGTIDFSPMTQIDIGDSYDKDFRTRRVFSYFIAGDQFTVFPQPNDTSKFFRVWYYRRPNAMVETSACAAATAIDTTLGTVSTSAYPSSWSTSSSLELIMGHPHFRTLQTSTPNAILANVFTFSSVSTSSRVGDYLSLEGETCIPQLPYEIWPFLIQGAVVQIFKILGNSQAWQLAESELQRTMGNARSIIGPRADEEPKKLVSGWW